MRSGARMGRRFQWTISCCERWQEGSLDVVGKPACLEQMVLGIGLDSTKRPM